MHRIHALIIKIRNCVGLLLLLTCEIAIASAPIEVVPTWHGLEHIRSDRVITIVKDKFAVDSYSKITAQVIHDNQNLPEHIVVHLFSEKTYEVAMVDIDTNYNVQSVKEDHQPNKLFYSNQVQKTQPKCPDREIQFLSIAPEQVNRSHVGSWGRDDLIADQSLEFAKKVADAAIKNGYKTKTLFEGEGTTQNILNYMVCPNLVGTYFSGHAGSHSILTHNQGHLSYIDIDTYLSGRLNNVTNIWVACNAFKDPLLSAMKRTGAQAYAAGENAVGGRESDSTAACAMEAALEGKPMKASFDNCKRKDGRLSNHWGWYSGGSDIFAN